MPDCSSIDSLVTPYIDGELAASERQVVAEHLQACERCHSRVAAEQAAHHLVQARRADLERERASSALRTKCSALGTSQSVRGSSTNWSPATSSPKRPVPTKSFPPFGFSNVGKQPAGGRGAVSQIRRRLAPLALAATLVVLVGGAFLYRLTESSSRVMAAELTADHVKCFAMNKVLGTYQSAAAVQTYLADSFGWPVRLPETGDLELIGSRPCMYGEGRIAHIMYRHNGEPVSVFMLPRANRSEQLVEVFGHKAAIWSIGDRTFVLIAEGTRAEVERLAGIVHASLR